MIIAQNAAISAPTFDPQNVVEKKPHLEEQTEANVLDPAPTAPEETSLPTAVT